MIRPLSFATVLVLLVPAAFAEVKLAESRDGDRVLRTDVSLEVDGKLVTRSLGGAKSLDLEVRAKHVHRARALPPAGRDHAALRSLRRYDTAEARIVVEENRNTSNLASDRRTFVADGTRDGIRLHAPDFLVTTREIDLLDVPGDPLAAAALLPGDDRDVGDEWIAPHWATQMLTGLEALEKGDLTCTLSAVAGGLARIDLAGKVKGGRRGAEVELELDGHLLFDVEGAFVSHLELEQRDERTVGPVSPGMKVVAKVRFDREPTSNDRGVTADYARTLPLEPETRALLVSHPLPWNAELRLDRSWYLFHQTSRVALLRRMRNGNLVAQCNVKRIEPAAPGRHLDVGRFEESIVAGLGEQFEEVVERKRIDTGDDRYVHRVIADGANVVEGGERPTAVPMRWIHYLVASPSGRQLTFAFVVEKGLLRDLANADEAIIRASRFSEGKAPTRAARRDP